MYCLSMSAVRVFSLYVPFACPFVPITLIVACSLSIRLWGILYNSSCSIAVSDNNVNMKAYFPSAVFIISCTCSVVGIIGTGGSY